MKLFISSLAAAAGFAALASAASIPRPLSLRSLAARAVTDADRCSVASDIGGAFGGNCGVYRFCDGLFTGDVAFDPNFGFVANDAMIANDGFPVPDGENYPDGVANENYMTNDESWVGLDGQIEMLLDGMSNGGYLDGVMSGWLGFLGNLGFANDGFDSVYDGYASYDIFGVQIDVSAIEDADAKAVAEGTLAMYSAICLALQDCGEFSTSGSFAQCLDTSGECQKSWIGDGECDAACDKLEYFYDGGDCTTFAEGMAAAASTDAFTCPDSWLGDGTCDMICNTLELGYDNGDCVLPNLEDAASQIGGVLLGGIGALGNAVADAAGSLVDESGPAMSDVIDVAGSALDEAGNVVNDVIDSALDEAGNVVNEVIDGGSQVAGEVADAAGTTVDAAGNVASDLVEAAASVVDAAGNALNEAGNVVNDLVNQAAPVVNEAVNAASNALEQVGQAAGQVVNEVAQGAEEAVNAIDNLLNGN